jgi:hypothetical protein
MRKAWLWGQEVVQVSAEAPQSLQSLRSGVQSLLLGLKDRAAFLFSQHPDGVSQAPAGSAQHLQAVDRRHEQRNAMVAYYPDTFGKAVEGLEIKPGKVNALKLFGGIRHEKLLAAGF